MSNCAHTDTDSIGTQYFYGPDRRLRAIELAVCLDCQTTVTTSDERVVGEGEAALAGCPLRWPLPDMEDTT